MTINLVELQNKIHAQNVEMGWWDEERPYHVFACLFHSELSEAMEGDRKGLMDDHLPKYPMFQVELADFVIRCLDYLGSVNFDGYYSGRYDDDILLTSTTELIANAHFEVSESLRYSMERDPCNCAHTIAACVDVCFSWCAANNIDLHKIILEKVEYNKHRADHKRENRAKEGGKKY